MFSTGDLLPQQSGSASIGVATNGLGNFIDNIKPYAHVHMNSGVIHDPIGGQSGVLRFSRGVGIVNVLGTSVRTEAFEVSTNGGKDFPLGISTPDNHVILRSPDAGNKHFFILASGNINILSQNNCNILGLDEIHLDGAQVVLNAVGNNSIVDILSEGNIEGVANADVLLRGVSDVQLSAGSLLGDGLGGSINLSPYGGSGQLEFRFGPHQAWYAKLTHSSAGGPYNDGFWPLPHSGQIAQMIAQATPGGSVDLQQAYDNGNEIDHRRDGVGYKGILVRETSPGFNGNFLSNEDITANKPGKYGIAVSGHTLTPNTPNSYAFAALNSLGLSIASSGSVSALSRSFFLGYAAANPNIVFFNSDGSLRFAVGDNTGAGTGGQIQFQPFGASGRLEYRFGPHQAWAQRMTHSSVGGPANDGFWPIPHSGQMLEQIARAIKTKAITIERPAVNNDLTIWYTNEAITIHEVESVLRGTADASGSFAIRHSTNRSLAGTELTTDAIQCTSRSTGQITTSFAAPNIPADSWVWIGVSGVSGVATTQMNVTIQYR